MYVSILGLEGPACQAPCAGNSRSVNSSLGAALVSTAVLPPREFMNIYTCYFLAQNFVLFILWYPSLGFW
jgi:hypothetical protein